MSKEETRKELATAEATYYRGLFGATDKAVETDSRSNSVKAKVTRSVQRLDGIISAIVKGDDLVTEAVRIVVTKFCSDGGIDEIRKLFAAFEIIRSNEADEDGLTPRELSKLGRDVLSFAQIYLPALAWGKYARRKGEKAIGAHIKRGRVGNVLHRFDDVSGKSIPWTIDRDGAPFQVVYVGQLPMCFKAYKSMVAKSKYAESKRRRAEKETAEKAEELVRQDILADCVDDTDIKAASSIVASEAAAIQDRIAKAERAILDLKATLAILNASGTRVGVDIDIDSKLYTPLRDTLRLAKGALTQGEAGKVYASDYIDVGENEQEPVDDVDSATFIRERLAFTEGWKGAKVISRRFKDLGLEYYNLGAAKDLIKAAQAGDGFAEALEKYKLAAQAGADLNKSDVNLGDIDAESPSDSNVETRVNANAQ